MCSLLSWLWDTIQCVSFNIFHQVFCLHFTLRQYFISDTLSDEFDRFEPMLLTFYSSGHQYEWSQKERGHCRWYQDMGKDGAVLEYRSLRSRQSYFVMIKHGQYPIDICVLLQQTQYFLYNDIKHILYANLQDDITGETYDISESFNKFAGPQGNFSFNGETYYPEMFLWYKQQYNICLLYTSPSPRDPH